MKMFAKLFLILLVRQTVGKDSIGDILHNVSTTYQQASGRTGKLIFNYYPNSYAEPPYDSYEDYGIESEYDFVIIGSGSGGSVLANRLSEHPHWKILLIEVGREPTQLVDIPALGDYFQFTDYNWAYLMEKQENMCLGLADQRMHWPRGRVLGGTTIINYMMHVRGNRRDYDRWAAQGNRGWSYKDVLPYFKKSEDYQVLYQDEEYHNRGGYLGVQDNPYRSGSAHAFVKAIQEYGYPYVDYNGEDQMGVSYIHGTTRRGKRSSALRAFLDTARYRPNLKVLTNTMATKILIHPETKRAYAVEFVRNKRVFYVKSSKEVLLSAGAFNSPQLLMLSGVGPKEHLRQLGIPLIQDLPVGEKLYDHLTFLGLAFTVNQSIVLQSSSTSNSNAFAELAMKGTGPLTNLGGVEAISFIRTPTSTDPDPDLPDVELIFIGTGMQADMGQFYRRTFRVSDRQYDAIWRPLENKYVFSIWPMVFHPKSHGFLRLKSKNPFHRPKLYGNYLTDPEGADIRTFISAIREIQRVVKMPAFQKFDARLVTTPIPGCEYLVYDSDEYWECGLRHLTHTLHHQIATCKMGPPTDPEAVVDDQLRVYGVRNLRVVDTSIIPMPLTAHTNVPTYMVGEKAADLIKKEWRVGKHDISPRMSPIYVDENLKN